MSDHGLDIRRGGAELFEMPIIQREAGALADSKNLVAARLKHDRC